MTHLEYEQAQRHKLPSLVYILDEDNQPVLPKFVETGPGAESLRNLKAALLKTHTVSFFTSPENLASKVLHDVPLLLKEVGKEVSGDPDAAQGDSAEIMARFAMLPQRYRGQEIVFEYSVASLRRLGPNECEAMGLPFGATVYDGARVYEEYLNLYASDDLAERLLDVPKGSIVTVRGVTAYGTSKELEWGHWFPENTWKGSRPSPRAESCGSSTRTHGPGRRSHYQPRGSERGTTTTRTTTKAGWPRSCSRTTMPRCSVVLMIVPSAPRVPIGRRAAARRCGIGGLPSRASGPFDHRARAPPRAISRGRSGGARPHAPCRPSGS